QKTGVITGFTVTVNPARLGLGASAHVILKLRQHNWRALRQQLLDIPEVWHVTLTGGPMDVILLVRAKDTADLRRVVFDEIQPLSGVVDTQTFMIFDDLVSRSALHSPTRWCGGATINAETTATIKGDHGFESNPAWRGRQESDAGTRHRDPGCRG